MGTMYQFKCNGCSYKVMAPKGKSVGMHAVIESQICNICKEVVEVTIGYYGDIISYNDMTMDEKVDAHCCLECHNMDLSDWSEGNRKCPKCLGQMEIDPKGGILCWD